MGQFFSAAEAGLRYLEDELDDATANDDDINKGYHEDPLDLMSIVDGGHIVPINWLYPVKSYDYDRRVVKKYIMNRKLCPFYRGFQDEDEIDRVKQQVLQVRKQQQIQRDQFLGEESNEIKSFKDAEEDTLDRDSCRESNDIDNFLCQTKESLKNEVKFTKEKVNNSDSLIDKSNSATISSLRKKPSAIFSNFNNRRRSNYSFEEMDEETLGRFSRDRRKSMSDASKKKILGLNKAFPRFLRSLSHITQSENTGKASSRRNSERHTTDTVNQDSMPSKFTDKNAESNHNLSQTPINNQNSSASTSKAAENVLVEHLLHDPIECPICFLYYPRNINYTRCCRQPICTECFLQIRRSEDEGNPASCPYCVEANFGVVYDSRWLSSGEFKFSTEPRQSSSKTGRSNTMLELPLSSSSSAIPDQHSIMEKSLEKDISPFKRSKSDVGDSLLSPRQISRFDPDSVVSSDDVRPKILESILAERRKYEQAIRVTSERLERRSRRFGLRSSRNDIGGSADNDQAFLNVVREYSSDLEEMMINEAIRLSMIEQEQREQFVEPDEEIDIMQAINDGLPAVAVSTKNHETSSNHSNSSSSEDYPELKLSKSPHEHALPTADADDDDDDVPLSTFASAEISTSQITPYESPPVAQEEKDSTL